MKHFKRIGSVVTLMVLLATMMVTAAAASTYKTPAEIVAGLTCRDLQSVIDECTTSGKSYTTIASDAGVLADYKAELLSLHKDNLAAQVTAGKLTQAQADALLTTCETNQLTCDGTGIAGTGKKSNLCNGLGSNAAAVSGVPGGHARSNGSHHGTGRGCK